MTIIKNRIIQGKHKKPILVDVFFNEENEVKPVVIFCHGYKGFKDWGAWNVMAKAFAKAGFYFVKFNFSHNGGTIEQPIDFPDLEAFGNNNYTKELDDLQSVIDWVCNDADKQINTNNINLIGHSRGGGIVTIKANEDARITKVITWAGVCDFGERTATIGDLEAWKTTGVKYVLNGRTKQHMPHYYQFYKDFETNKDRLNIENACKLLEKPHLIAHGVDDHSVLFSEAENLHHWNKNSVLLPIPNCNHVFNTKHPWENKQMSEELEFLVDETVRFIKLE